MRRIVLIISLVILVTAGILIAWWHYLSDESDKRDTPTNSQETSSDDTEKANEKQPSDANEQDPANDRGSNQTATPDTPTGGDGRLQVSILITDASQYGNIIEVRGSTIGGVAENGGTCTLTFVQGAKHFLRTTPGLMNASNTVCQTVEIPVSEFPSSGTWQVEMRYESGQAVGSTTRNFEVQK